MQRLLQPLDWDLRTIETTVVDLVDAWATCTPEATAVEWNGQRLSYAGLRDASLHVSQALLSVGAGPGDKIPIFSQVSLELLPAILGVLRVGACYVPIDMAAWSNARIDATLKDISPRVGIATSQTDTQRVPVIVFFQEPWLQSSFDNMNDTCSQLDAIRRGLDTNALVYITFTSGTTGKPKGVMIYYQALSKFVSLTGGDCFNTAPGERVLLAFSISFDACAATIWTTITRGGALVMASWSTFPELATTCDNLILTPSMLATLHPAGPFDKARSLYLGAEAPNFDIARQWITPTRKVIHTYGPSEATIVIAFGRVTADSEPDLGVIIPGVQVDLVDENLRESDVGEILISGPCLAAGYLNNPELTDKKFISWNGKRAYRTGDLARRTKTGLLWNGRADRMVKNRGFLINLETEVETGMLRFSNVRAASAFMWRNKLMGFVQPATVDLEGLREFMRYNFDQFVVPDEFVALDQFPLTAHGKVDRVALNGQLEDRMAQEDADLDTFVCSSSYGALRWAFAKCLHVPFQNLTRASSFSRLGGHSLAAILASKALMQQGYATSVLKIIREDTIDHLEAKLTKIHAQLKLVECNCSGNGIAPLSDAAPATDMHRLMLAQSAQNPMSNALVVSGRFTGTQDAVPTPRELQVAWATTLAAHSVFKTRYDLQTWTLHDLDHVNLDWQEVIVEADDFDNTLLSIEEQVWAHHRNLQSVRLDVPYSDMTCVYAPGPNSSCKAIGFVWRLHHVLMDIFSFINLTSDLEQALTKGVVTPGPRIADYARATLIFAAWALVLANYTGHPTASFFLSRSGRMVPWPAAPSLVAAMNSRVPFTTTLPTTSTVQQWLGEMHSTLHRVAELENLCQSLDRSIYPEPYFNTGVQAFLYMPSGPRSWEVHHRMTAQAESIGMVWRVQPAETGTGEIQGELEIDTRVVDLGWAEEVGAFAVGMLERLAGAEGSMRLGHLMSGSS
ncbi:acetyl-CoA synthetase-like protein [Aspergillus neoniger CBS 115656]|uniref:Acetyl-CoA synthetase-like protein n=1 Tax=Aspergillus neoniger (strain CBS 115656) TaxID=1448310 RepID=A0A318YT52_ASPNB|nr:acetyl-CoA synthetase-like protein [Aspergillus neoniger CBS 115656]PYH37619.1 acetyl-CoA synthetase-like protein [Aspergillus neoniger CBS 115656]